MHLIDAVALEREGWYLNRIIQTDKNAMEYQTKKPTEFPAIEPERKTGEWLPDETGWEFCCSECGYSVMFGGETNTFKYCPECGAKMEETE